MLRTGVGPRVPYIAQPQGDFTKSDSYETNLESCLISLDSALKHMVFLSLL